MPMMPARHKPHRAAARTHTVVEQQRGTSSARGYGYKWQQARKGYLSRHPLCIHCQAKGRVSVATEVDHIIPHKGDMAIFWNKSNWQPLCKVCHSRKTAAEDGGFGNRDGGVYFGYK